MLPLLQQGKGRRTMTDQTTNTINRLNTEAVGDFEKYVMIDDLAIDIINHTRTIQNLNNRHPLTEDEQDEIIKHLNIVLLNLQGRLPFRDITDYTEEIDRRIFYGIISGAIGMFVFMMLLGG